MGEQFLKNVPRNTESLNKGDEPEGEIFIIKKKKKKKNKTVVVQLSMVMTLILLLAKIFH